MVVTFKCNSRCLSYKPGTVYTAELTPLLKAVLEQDRHLSLIDPPSFDLPPEPEPKPKPEPKPITMKLIKKKEEEKLDDGHQQESI